MPRLVRFAAILLALGASVASCTTPSGGPTTGPTDTPEVTAMPFTLTSAAFADGAAIPRRWTCQGEGPSPLLAWSGAPPGTAAFALIVDDPDASGWVHWLLYDLPAATTGLPEGISGSIGTPEGRNSWGGLGWRGPCPPSGTHRYVFRLLALSAPLGLPPGAEVTDVRRAAAGVTLAQAILTGTYRRS